MTVSPAMCRADATLDQVARLMVEHDYGEIPVVDDSDKVIGVITDRARVHDQDLGLLRIVDTDVSLALQDAAHELGVGDVHLTPVGLDVVALWLAHGGPI